MNHASARELAVETSNPIGMDGIEFIEDVLRRASPLPNQMRLRRANRLV